MLFVIALNAPSLSGPIERSMVVTGDDGGGTSTEAEGTHSATLVINSDDPDEGCIEVGLTATAVAPEVPADEQIGDARDFMDEVIADGELVGTGDGYSSDNRLNAFETTLQSATDQYEGGDRAGAIGTLNALYKKCDGEPKPPDHVTGDAAAELRTRILWLIGVIEEEMGG